MLGTFVLSAGYYDAYYGKAQKVRRLIKERIDDILDQYDYLILPIAPSTAWEIGAKQDDPIAVYLSDVFTVLANLTGNPAIALPIDKDSDDMPIGIQLMSKYFSEKDLLAISHNLLI